MPTDMSQLPPPEVYEQLDYETVYERNKQTLIGRNPAYATVLSLESEPITELLQEVSYLEVSLRAEINNKALQLSLAYATGADLDYIGLDRYKLPRKVLVAGDPAANPPVDPVFESDDDYRARLQSSPEALSVGGPKLGYEAIAMSAHDDVADAEAISPSESVVEIYVISYEGNGTPAPEVITAVETACSADTERPMTDYVTAYAATITEVSVEAELVMIDGLDDVGQEEARQQAEDNVTAFADKRRDSIGNELALSKLYSLLHVAGVKQVNLTSPAADTPVDNNEAAVITSINVSIAP